MSQPVDKDRLKNMLQLYKIFKKINARERVALLDLLKDDGCDYICEGVHNFLSNVKLKTEARTTLMKRLKRKKKELRYLSNRENDIESRKKILKQSGAGIGLILSAVLPLLTTLIRK